MTAAARDIGQVLAWENAGPEEITVIVARRAKKCSLQNVIRESGN
jgi:hypothetical protein